MATKKGVMLAAAIIVLVSLLPPWRAAFPASAPKPEPAAADTAHPKVAVDLLLTRSGTGAYALGYGLSDIFKKNHPWMTINPIDTFGGYDNVRLVDKRSQKERETTIFMAGDAEFAEATAGRPPFQKKHPIQLITHVYQRQGSAFGTLDPNIKTYKEMIGKRVAVTPVAHGLTPQAESMLKTWGIMDKVKIARMDMPQMPAALMDGSVDLALVPVSCFGTTWIVDANFKVVTKPMYFISWTKEFADKLPGLTGYVKPSVTIPARMLLPSQTEPLAATTTFNMWACYPEITSEIPYQVAKMVNEKAKLFEAYHALGRSVPFIPEVLAAGPYTKKDFHTGALKYFAEVGITIHD